MIPKVLTPVDDFRSKEKKTYLFILPATYAYRIKADSEGEAREKLMEAEAEGIEGSAYPPQYKDYLNADLECIEETDS